MTYLINYVIVLDIFFYLLNNVLYNLVFYTEFILLNDRCKLLVNISKTKVYFFLIMHFTNICLKYISECLDKTTIC